MLSGRSAHLLANASLGIILMGLTNLQHRLLTERNLILVVGQKAVKVKLV
jgi:hypothetical protein